MMKQHLTFTSQVIKIMKNNQKYSFSGGRKTLLDNKKGQIANKHTWYNFIYMKFKNLEN